MSKVTITVKFAARTPWDEQSDWQREANGYTCELRYQGRRMTVDYWMGIAHTDEPTVGDVLESLLSDASSAEQSFEDWAGDYGYDTDSRTAERTYRQVVAQTAKLRQLLGADFDSFLYSAQS